MLIEFSVSNFRSIKSTQSLSMVKGKGEEFALENTFVSAVPSSPELLRSAVIYGANAAGKSNLIKALRIMERVVVESAAEFKPDDLLPVTSFLLDKVTAEQPTEFEVVFIVDNVRYQYGFSASSERIIEEWLFAYPKGRAQSWFSRVWDEGGKKYDWDVKYIKGQKQVWQDSTRANALFLSTAAQLNSDDLKPIYNWFKKKIHIAGVGAWGKGYSTFACEDEQMRQKIVSFLKAADLGIDGIKVSKEKFDASVLPDDMPEAIKQEIASKLDGKEVTEIKTVHQSQEGYMVEFDLDEESDGTQKMFAFAAPWLDTLEKGNVLFIDELHDNLHPKLVGFLVGLFHNPETNPNNAQLIFTTHETSILSQDVFRRDQIWFCEKNAELATELIPLSDYSPRKDRENLEAAYLSGRYGALPYVGKLKLV